MNLAKKKANPNSSYWLKKCDQLARKKALEINGNHCNICRKTEHIQCHHIYPREYISLRFDPRNIIPLCVGHHKYFLDSAHRNGFWFALWIQRNWMHIDWLRQQPTSKEHDKTFKQIYEEYK